MEDINLFTKEKQTNLYELLREVNRLKKSLVDGCFNQNGKLNKDSITFSQFQMLQLINYFDGNCILKDISEKSGISKGALSIMITKLELMNLIEKYLRKDQTDKRSISIKLTERGKKILVNKEKELSNIIEKEMLSNLDKEDYDFISNVVVNTTKVLEKMTCKGDDKNE